MLFSYIDVPTKLSTR